MCIKCVYCVQHVLLSLRSRSGYEVFRNTPIDPQHYYLLGFPSFTITPLRLNGNRISCCGSILEDGDGDDAAVVVMMGRSWMG